MSNDHADFYLGTGPNARWLGSLAEFGGPNQVSRLDARAGHGGAPGVLSAPDPHAYEAAVAALLDHHRDAEAGFVAVPSPGEDLGWPWLEATSIRWFAYAFTDHGVRASLRGGPWFIPDLDLPDYGATTGTGPDAELRAIGDTTPKTATVTWSGFRGLPIPITQTLPPVPQTYLTHRGEVALAVASAAELVLGRRWPLADLNRATIHTLTLGLLVPGPAPNLYELPEGAPFAVERITVAFDFLVDADRYAEGNNPERGRELLASSASVAVQAVTAHRTHQPYPWPSR
ncbi:hypothetical protein GCM10010174_52370 [Kutzneria viridogrisea]|uniref:Uncharacterized protein n=1 Tax=Kutzneria viridogrisea TaxID=47990 RepID=A0ABR6BJ40_9PSEU|nr:hypothetical protein [Kutzneria viridogrisea]